MSKILLVTVKFIHFMRERFLSRNIKRILSEFFGSIMKVIFFLEIIRVDKIVCSVDDPLIQLIIFLPSTLFVVTAVGVIIYCCHRSRQLRKTKNQKTYRVFSPRNFDSKDISEFGARINDERALPNVKSPRIA